jgi:hypothetical protein
MTPGGVLFALGIITGGAFMSLIWVGVYMYSYPLWHREGYQDHRDETRELRNSADLAAIREPVIRDRHAPPNVTAPGAPDRPGPITRKGTRSRAVTRAYSGADNIPPVVWPEPGTRIPFRAQPAPAKHGARDTGRLRIAAAGDIPAITDDYLEAMRRRCAVDRAMIERGEPLDG